MLKSTEVTLHQGGSGGEKRFICSNGCVRDRGQSAGVARARRATNEFFRASGPSSRRAGGADLFAYRVTVRDGPREHSVAFTGEEGAAATLRELLVAVAGSKT